jgi:hypothetical protein
MQSRLYNPNAGSIGSNGPAVVSHGSVSELVNVPKDLAYFGNLFSIIIIIIIITIIIITIIIIITTTNITNTTNTTTA